MRNALQTLVARHGFRVTSANALELGIPERVLFDAARAGLARLERTHVLGCPDARGYGGTDVSVYLIFA